MLFLSFKFTQLQPTMMTSVNQQEAGNEIPFGFSYTEDTTKFLERVMNSCTIYPLKELRIRGGKFLKNYNKVR